MTEQATWSVWTNTEGLKTRCSVCGWLLKRAVVFPEHGLNICFGCLSKMMTTAAEIVEKENKK